MADLQSQSAKIKCSIFLISGYEFKVVEGREIDLSSEFIVIPIDRGYETMNISLSFKHVLRVEFLDNSESKGAGLIIHINDFMTRKLQNVLDEGNSKLVDFRSPYSETKFIVFDISNCDATNMNKIHNILYRAGLFHHQYTVKQMNKNKKAKIGVTLQFSSTITYLQWVALFSLLGINFIKLDKFNDRKQMQQNCTRNITSPIIDNLHISNPGNLGNLVHMETHRAKKQSTINSAPSPSIYTVNFPDVSQSMSVHDFLRLQNSSQRVSEVEINATTDSQTQTHSQSQENGPKAEHSPEIVLPFQTQGTPIVDDNTAMPANNFIQHTLLNQSTTPPSIQFFAIDQSKNIIRFSDKSLLPIQPPIRQQIRTANRLPTPQNYHDQNIIILGRAPNDVEEENTKATAKSLAQKVISRHKQKPKPQEIHLIDDDETETRATSSVSKKPDDTVLSYPPNAKDSCSVHYCDLKYLAVDVMLNDTIIDFYLKYIQHSLISEERRERIHIFNTFFFGKLTQAPAHGKQQVTLATKIRRIALNFQSLKNWTRKVDLFEKDYIVVPINEDIHWYLAIIVNPRACIYSNITKKPITDGEDSTKEGLKQTLPKPYLIVFNSLIDPAVDKHIEVRGQLAEYFQLEFKDKYQQNSMNNDRYFLKEMLQVVQPVLIPQQKGYIDCGLFLLHFAELFLTNPPKKITSHASFRHWFNDFQICDKRHQIKEVIRSLAPHVKPRDFIYYPPPNNLNKNRRSKRLQESTEANVPLMRRDRKQSESRIDEIQKDPRFSVLYRPRSLDSLIAENKEKPLVLQPPTKQEMKRFKKLNI